MNLAERIKLVLDETNLNRSQFANKIGVTPATVAFWCSGRTKNLRGDYASKISRIFGYAPFWLSEGKGPIKPDSKNEFSFPLVHDLDTEKVPLLKFEDIGNPDRIKGDSFLLTDRKMSLNSYAVEIVDSAMAPIFEKGERVIIDPEIKPRPGDFVVVQFSQEVPVFRKFRVLGMDPDGNKVFEFVPINSDYPSIKSNQIDSKILGTMTEHRKYRR